MQRWINKSNGLVLLAVVAGIFFGAAIRKGKQSVPVSAATRPVQASFQPTLVNAIPADQAAAPDGMAWIPGGEFSMGAEDPSHSPEGGNEPMEDARPIHRVSVHG